MKSEKKNLKKTIRLIKKNKPTIERIISSEKFMNDLFIIIDEIELDKNDEDDWFFFGIPIVMSNSLDNGLIMEMKNGEYTIVRGF